MHRSYLFVPGDAPGMLETIDVFDADAVIIDLEDSVAPNRKDEARALLEAFLTHHKFDHTAMYVRVNAVDETAWFEADIKALQALAIDGIVLPKATPKTLKTLQEVYADQTLPDVIALLETPGVFFQLPEVTAYPFVKGLMLGGEDLRQAIEAQKMPRSEELAMARGLIILAASEASIQAIDTPFTDIKDTKGLQDDAFHAAKLGMHGKACIHPNHVQVVNTVFTPDQKSIEQAERIIAMHEKTQSMRFSLDGFMVDKPVIERAKRTVKRAKQFKGRRV